MTNKLAIFYHYYISDDERGAFWNWWLDEQCKEIETSLMSARVPIYLHATMPKHWNTIYNIPITKNGTQDVQVDLEYKFREYISEHYNFLKLIDVRDTGEPNIYEGSTLIPLWDYAKHNPNQYVGYIHNKGVLSVSPHTCWWRKELSYWFIRNWRDRYIELLEAEYDVVGLKDLKTDDTTLSGNFFYASTNYIASLDKPDFGGDRYKYEKWILSGNPKLHIVHNTKKDQFIEY